MNETDIDTESAWIRRSRSGEKDVFGLLVQRYMKQAYFGALGFLGSHDDALDASQEAFVRAFLSLDRFDETRSFFPWYYQILRNHCLNVLRHRGLKTPALSELTNVTADMASDDPLPDEVLERADLRSKVWEAIWLLDAEDRELIVARDILDTPYTLLAELIGCPEGTVMSRVFHARRRLRVRLQEVSGP